MSCSIVHILTFFSIISIPNVIATSLLQETCSKTSHIDFCLQLFQSDQKIASATNLFDLSTAVMESGISNATNTHNYINDKFKETNLAPKFMNVLQVCNSSYSWAIGSMRSALGEVNKIKEYNLASYDLSMASYDAIEPCLKALASQEIKDDIILSGNKALETFASSAVYIVDVLSLQGIK